MEKSSNSAQSEIHTCKYLLEKKKSFNSAMQVSTLKEIEKEVKQTRENKKKEYSKDKKTSRKQKTTHKIECDP